jgi:hypothetical protein
LIILTRKWLIRTLRNKELKIASSRKPESPSVEPSLAPSNK